jgi:NADH-quinone oxidoreductase subunit H
MRFGWKVLIPVGLGWVVLSGAGMVLLPHFNRNTSYFVIFAPIIAGLLAWVVFSLVADSKALKRDEAEAQRRARFETDEFDAFAGGYPVPPLPGQKLPPSPRSGRTVDAAQEAQGD